MIPNCPGCEQELWDAFEYQQTEGWHLANDGKYSVPGKKGHLCIIMVDDKGRVRLW
ncbi:hypothetical protein HYS48_05280 [Candidatus Woesearchaeota archaeon]|nr:hypothetical protein [Candidatus Woesearchaeota archaeon]